VAVTLLRLSVPSNCCHKIAEKIKGGDITKKVLLSVTGGVVVLLAVACVTASSLAVSTPLYTVRMEQASSRMNFLPAEKNGFIYAAENGYNLNYEVTAYCGDMETLGKCTYNETTCAVTCETCETCETCPGMFTCENTSCQPTCPLGTCAATCAYTCPYTCDYSCEGGYTCYPICL